MTMKTRPAVLTGVDGSAESLAGLELAASEAARRNEPLHVLHACEWPTYTAALPMPGASVLTQPIETADALLQDAVKRVHKSHPQVDVTTEVVVGGAAASLLTASASAAMVVLGTRGAGGFTGLLAGSVATQVSTHAKCPVIVVPPGADPSDLAARTHPVVVGVDCAERSEPAVAFAFEEASLRGVSLTALHMWAEPPRGHSDPFKPVAYDYDEAHREATRALAEALAGFQEKYPDVPVFQELRCSLHPALNLLVAAKEASLVVVGSRGRGGFKGLLLGSVGQALIHHANCPVAVVRTNG
jgi:nucleotide-binding universal stress UspA family protein